MKCFWLECCQCHFKLSIKFNLFVSIWVLCAVKQSCHQQAKCIAANQKGYTTFDLSFSLSHSCLFAIIFFVLMVPKFRENLPFHRLCSPFFTFSSFFSLCRSGYLFSLFMLFFFFAKIEQKYDSISISHLTESIWQTFT